MSTHITGYSLSVPTLIVLTRACLGKLPVKMLAQYEGILLDPVYSGKGFAGLIDLIRKGHFKKGENVVFLHTGGSVSLFGYPETFDLPGYI